MGIELILFIIIVCIILLVIAFIAWCMASPDKTPPTGAATNAPVPLEKVPPRRAFVRTPHPPKAFSFDASPKNVNTRKEPGVHLANDIRPKHDRALSVTIPTPEPSPKAPTPKGATRKALTPRPPTHRPPSPMAPPLPSPPTSMPNRDIKICTPTEASAAPAFSGTPHVPGGPIPSAAVAAALRPRAHKPAAKKSRRRSEPFLIVNAPKGASKQKAP